MTAIPSHVYVQDVLRKRLADEVIRVLREDKGHLYVCGDVRMARDVARTLKDLFATRLKMNEEQTDNYFFQLKSPSCLMKTERMPSWPPWLLLRIFS
ncbi:nitric oxide synthase, inducible-like [Vombatus ursinus]|uniref:nitric oxide synthase, inducible-like n=1 Tax=Vombatus ursinus TaxID=29139 RepID=UPI000FFDAA50|nr:nitric oxide synthase, inducible-like [Vombatus ursinus]